MGVVVMIGMEMEMRMRVKKTKWQKGVEEDEDGDENYLETKMLEAAQATRYPPEANHKENY